MSKKLLYFAFPYSIVLILLVIVSSPARADVTGSLAGVIHDRGQAVLVGARVTISNSQTNLSQSTVSGAEGSYRFLALAAGTYKVSVSALGFRPYSTNEITVQVNDQLKLDITLEVGTVIEEVDVSDNLVREETETTQLGDVIDSKKMLSLPLNGRSHLDLLGLQAGVAPGSAGTIGGDRPVSGYISSAGNISVNGQRETANAFLVNGGDVSEGGICFRAMGLVGLALS